MRKNTLISILRAMFWADIIAKNLKDKGPHLVDDAKTPSGKVHVGALRGVLIHDFVHKALLEMGAKSRYTYIFDDFDPMDSLPVYLDKSKYEKYMGAPLKNIPAPEGEGSYAEYYAHDFRTVFNSLGAKPEILWNSKLYEEGKLDKAIRVVLDNAEQIQEIYHQVSGSQKEKGWLPFQPVCENCGKIGTTRAYDWDGQEVKYKCESEMVEWARGCSHEGKVSPFGGSGKMPWKVEWPAKWFVLGVTIEGAGKDHSSKGGARDVGVKIIREVFKKEPPYDVSYEFINLGGKKMSSSKGLGSSALEVAEILPPEVLRFLFARVPAQRSIDFDPTQETTIPNLFDEFDRGQKAHFSKENPDLAKTWEASQIGEIKQEFVPRFNLIKEALSNFKNEEEILSEAGKLKGEKLSKVDEEAIKLRIKYVKIWLERFGKEEKASEKAVLSPAQKKLLEEISQALKETQREDEVQNFIYNRGRQLGLTPQETFQAVYKALLGKSQGPKAGKLVLSLGFKKAKEKFLEAAK